MKSVGIMLCSPVCSMMNFIFYSCLMLGSVLDVLSVIFNLHTRFTHKDLHEKR